MAEQISEQQLTQWENWGIHNRELSGLIAAYRAQAEEIEQMVPRRMVESLKQDLFRAQEEIERLKAQSKPTRAEVEDAPKAAEPVSPTTFIGGVRMDTTKRIPTVAEMQGILKEADPLKVDELSERIEDHSERIALLEQQLRAHLGKEAE